MNFFVICFSRRTELQKNMIFSFLNLHNRGLIPTPVTVIRSRPQGHERFILKVINMTLFYQLMSSYNSLQVIHLKKLIYYMPAEDISSSSIVYWPAFFIRWLWIWPDQIAHKTALGNIPNSIDLIDTIRKRKRRRQTSMDTKHLRIYNSS